jgi:Cu-Zn family superoxide dismutase
MNMKRFAVILVACIVPFVAVNAQDSAKEKIEEILRKIERAGGKNKDKEKEAAAAAAKAKDADYVPNVPGPKERKDGALARVKFKGTGKADNISGQIIFKQKGDRVLLAPVIQGLPDGEYGFHVHVRGDCSAADFTSAGDHFNPESKKHGSRQGEHHAGDLGNLKMQGGKPAPFEPLEGVTVTVSKTGIIGRSVIIHANPDDLTTQPGGNAGPRIACGVITYDN